MTRLFRCAYMLAVAALFGLSGSLVGNAGEPQTKERLLVLYSTQDAPTQTCKDGSVSSQGCPDAGVRIATGNECPANSGDYCSDETPYCCGTPGNYYCATDVNHC